MCGSFAARDRLDPFPHTAPWCSMNPYFGMVGGERAGVVGLDGCEHPKARVLDALSGIARACGEIENREHNGIYIGRDWDSIRFGRLRVPRTYAAKGPTLTPGESQSARSRQAAGGPTRPDTSSDMRMFPKG